jgi:menaquinone-9 beta-reductase
LKQAAVAGAEIRRGHAVTRPRSDAPTILHVDGMGKIRADVVFLATGKHDLRGLRRQPATEVEDLIGFKTHPSLSAAQLAALAGHVDVVMFPDGYAGLQRVENGRVNFCLLTKRARLKRAGGDWGRFLAELLSAERHLCARLYGALPLHPRPLAIYRVPYGFVYMPFAEDASPIFRLGDQVAVIPSFTRDGMSIALHSASMAVESNSAASQHSSIIAECGAILPARSGGHLLCIAAAGRRPARHS